jgi:hypothetical protein
MSANIPIHRAWCGVCRSFTDHREMTGEEPRKLECVSCSDDRRST